MSEAALQEMIETSASLGWQLGIHAIGDEAIVTVADTYSRALEKYPKRDARWYLAHPTMIPPASTPDLMARNGIFAAVRPNFLHSVEGRGGARRAGEGRCREMAAAHQVSPAHPRRHRIWRQGPGRD